MRAVLPVDIRDVDHAQPGLMHERGRLDSPARTLVLHAMTGDAAEFLVNPWRELPQSVLVAACPGA
jgi:hypothetical protein